MDKRLENDVDTGTRDEAFEAMLAAVARTDHVLHEFRSARHAARRKKRFEFERRRRRWWKGKQQCS
jgi:hypothetical protein